MAVRARTVRGLDLGLDRALGEGLGRLERLQPVLQPDGQLDVPGRGDRRHRGDLRDDRRHDRAPRRERRRRWVAARLLRDEREHRRAGSRACDREPRPGRARGLRGATRRDRAGRVCGAGHADAAGNVATRANGRAGRPDRGRVPPAGRQRAVPCVVAGRDRRAVVATRDSTRGGHDLTGTDRFTELWPLLLVLALLLWPLDIALRRMSLGRREVAGGARLGRAGSGDGDGLRVHGPRRPRACWPRAVEPGQRRASGDADAAPAASTTRAGSAATSDSAGVAVAARRPGPPAAAHPPDACPTPGGAHPRPRRPPPASTRHDVPPARRRNAAPEIASRRRRRRSRPTASATPPVVASGSMSPTRPLALCFVLFAALRAWPRAASSRRPRRRRRRPTSRHGDRSSPSAASRSTTSSRATPAATTRSSRPTAISFDASGLDQPTPVRIYLYMFRNRATFERLRATVDACARSFVTDPETYESLEQSPYVIAGQGPWGPQFKAALRAGARGRGRHRRLSRRRAGARPLDDAQAEDPAAR